MAKATGLRTEQIDIHNFLEAFIGRNELTRINILSILKQLTHEEKDLLGVEGTSQNEIENIISSIEKINTSLLNLKINSKQDYNNLIEKINLISNNLSTIDESISTIESTLNGKLNKNDKANNLDVINGTDDEKYVTSAKLQHKINSIPDKPPIAHEHKISDIKDFPLSLPADGGNSDTVDNKHVDDNKIDNMSLWTAHKIQKELNKKASTVILDQLSEKVNKAYEMAELSLQLAGGNTNTSSK